MSRLATNNPTHRRIMTEALGIVHVLVSGKPTEHGLPQQTDQRMAAVLASARIGEHLTRQHGQPEHIVKFAIGEQPGIGGDHGAAKLEHQAAIKIEPDGIRFRFTRWVRHRRLPSSRISRCALYLNRGDRWRNQSVIRGIQVEFVIAVFALIALPVARCCGFTISIASKSSPSRATASKFFEKSSRTRSIKPSEPRRAAPQCSAYAYVSS